MYRLFGFTFYLSEYGLFAYALLYLPLAVGVFKLVRVYGLSMISDPDVQKHRTRVVAALIFSLPLWDVLAISIEANYLCRTQGGIHVYKTAVADSVLNSWGIATLAPYGFKYTEGQSGDSYFRYRLQNGKVVEERIDAFTARYRTGGGVYQKLDAHFAKTVLELVDTTNGEVLSDLVKFHVSPGLFDAIVLSSLPMEITGIPWICGHEPPSGRKGNLNFDDLVIRALRPTGNENGAPQ